MLSDRNREYKVEHKGTLGLGWIAFGLIVAALILNPDNRQVDCFVGVTEACAAIAETYK